MRLQITRISLGAVVYGLLCGGEALAALVMGKRAFGLSGDQLQTLAFETLFFINELAVLSVRERRWWVLLVPSSCSRLPCSSVGVNASFVDRFWTSHPSWQVRATAAALSVVPRKRA